MPDLNFRHDTAHLYTRQRNVLLLLMKGSVRQNRWVMGTIVSIFTIYNFMIYLQGSGVKVPPMSRLAIEGEQLYQAKNCASCHQLYGLGGYLGPDLTNVISHKTKGPGYVRAFLNSGSGAMPVFHFNEHQQQALIAFLSHVDSTGFYPDRNAVFSRDGWVSINYKE